MTKQMMQRLRGERIDGYPVEVTMRSAAEEIERLNIKCGALAYLHYGSSGPDDPWQAKLDEVTKPLHAEIERLRKLLDGKTFVTSPDEPSIEQQALANMTRYGLALERIEGLATGYGDVAGMCARIAAETLRPETAPPVKSSVPQVSRPAADALATESTEQASPRKILCVFREGCKYQPNCADLCQGPL